MIQRGIYWARALWSRSVLPRPIRTFQSCWHFPSAINVLERNQVNPTTKTNINNEVNFKCTNPIDFIYNAPRINICIYKNISLNMVLIYLTSPGICRSVFMTL